MNLIIKNLYKNYFYSDNFALTNINASFAQGINVVYGDEKSGKTTLLKCIAGLESVSEGEILVSEDNIANCPVKGKGVIMLFEDLALSDKKTVFDVLAYPLEIRKVERQAIIKQIKIVLKLFEIEAIGECKIKNLSEENKIKTSFARLFMREAQVYLIDNPLNALALPCRVVLAEFIKQRLCKLKGVVIFATDCKREGKVLADNLSLLTMGKLVCNSNLAQLNIKPPCIAVVNYFEPQANLIKASLIDGILNVLDCSFKINDTAVNEIYSGQNVVCLIYQNEVKLCVGEAFKVVESITIDDRVYLELTDGENTVYTNVASDESVASSYNITVAPKHIKIFDNKNENLLYFV